MGLVRLPRIDPPGLDRREERIRMPETPRSFYRHIERNHACLRLPKSRHCQRIIFNAVTRYTCPCKMTFSFFQSLIFFLADSALEANKLGPVSQSAKNKVYGATRAGDQQSFTRDLL